MENYKALEEMKEYESLTAAGAGGGGSGGFSLNPKSK